MSFNNLYFQLEEKFDDAPFANVDVNGTAFEFDDWADAVEADGWICRDALDCTWIDDSMECTTNPVRSITVRIDSRVLYLRKSLRGHQSLVVSLTPY